ncbi:hypothetical protein T09_15386 [Trichinella sp. T9]|nr:hypothetical protein T09_15386 [Trichinella sp. T9]
MRLYISIGTGTVDKLIDKILDNVLGSSRFHQLFSRHVMFSDESDNRNPSNYEGVEESKYNA